MSNDISPHTNPDTGRYKDEPAPTREEIRYFGTTLYQWQWSYAENKFAWYPILPQVQS